MIDIFSINQITPEQIIVVLVGLVFLTIIAAFILPAILRVEKLSFAIFYSLKKVRKNLAWSVTVAVVVGVLLGGSIFYYFASLPTVVTAAEFKNAESEALKQLESITTFEVQEKGSIYLMDTRSHLDYFNSHVGGSFNASPKKFDPSKFEPDNSVAFYSSKDEFDEAYRMARSLKLEKPKNLFLKVYVIKNGFEGLREAGIEIRSGDIGEEQIGEEQ